MSFTLIEDPVALERLCASVSGKPWVALDTEFTRERTFYARLGLLQLATDDRVACVDPLRVDLTPLLDTLYDRRILKVLHAGRQDLEVLYDLRGEIPRPIFDTQIAAALLGHADQIGYAALVESITGVKLAKLHTRTNWEARPLTPEQLRYAADDVAYLRDVYLAVDTQLRERRRLDWMTQECEAMSNPALFRNDPESAYLRLSGGNRLAPAAQPLLKELATWRERTAQMRDRPRAWIATDAALIEIARAAPADLAALRALPAVSPATANSHGAEILDIVRRMAGAAPVRLWPNPDAPSPMQQDMARQMLTRIKAVAEANDVNAGIIASRRTVLALIREGRGPLTAGWRHELVGADLLVMADGALAERSALPNRQ